MNFARLLAFYEVLAPAALRRLPARRRHSCTAFIYNSGGASTTNSQIVGMA
jgi:hypothetical protein